MLQQPGSCAFENLRRLAEDRSKEAAAVTAECLGFDRRFALKACGISMLVAARHAEKKVAALEQVRRDGVFRFVQILPLTTVS